VNKIPTTQVCALLKREYKIKTTARELNEFAVSFGMSKEYRRVMPGGFPVYYWSEEDIERLKIEML